MGVASGDRMAMFAAARRAPSVRPGHEETRHAVSVAGHDLAARLRELGASAGSLEDALEPMLQAILQVTGATAGALCLYDVRAQALCLAAEIGLSDEGRGKLRHIARRGEGDSWGIPLHGMLNRRCYLIEHAAQNRFVPPLIPDANTIETVACLPVYGGDAPLASLVLVTRAPRVLGERALHGVEAPVHEIGRVIEAMRQRTLGGDTKPPTSALVPALGAGASGGSAIAPPSGVPSADSACLAGEITRVERERDQLAVDLETSRRDGREKAEALAAELTRRQARLEEAEAGAAHEQRAREALEMRVAAGISVGRDELRQAREAAREAEHAHAAALAEVAELRSALERERQSARTEASIVSVHLAEETDRQLEVPLHPSHAPPDEDRIAALEEAATHLHDARAQAWDAAARLVETEVTLDASREEYTSQISLLTVQLGAVRKELAVVRAISVRAVRVHARAMARQRVSDLRDVVHDLEGCADVIDRIRLPGAGPLREAAARFADVASHIAVDYGRADP